MIDSPQGPSARRPKPPPNPFTPAMPMPCSSHASPSRIADAGVDENLAHFVALVRLDVVVAEHGGDRDAQRVKLLRQDGRLLGQSVVGQVAGISNTSAASEICAKSDWNAP